MDLCFTHDFFSRFKVPYLREAQVEIGMQIYVIWVLVLWAGHRFGPFGGPPCFSWERSSWQKQLHNRAWAYWYFLKASLRDALPKISEIVIDNPVSLGSKFNSQVLVLDLEDLYPFFSNIPVTVDE